MYPLNDDSEIEEETGSTSPKHKKNKIRKESSDSVPEKKHSSKTKEICAICLCSMDGDIGSPELCDHSFCLECILEWSKNKNNCPQDRITFLQIFVRRRIGGKIIRTIPIEKSEPKVEEIGDVDDVTFCEVCGHCDREDILLLCDECDSGYHLDCLNPPLERVPVAEWFCPECQGVGAPRVQGDGDVEGIDASELNDLIDDSIHLIRDLPSRRTLPARILPRTIISERVRANIQARRQRTSTTVNTERRVITPPDLNVPSTSGVNQRTTARKKKTTKKRVKRTVKKVTKKKGKKKTIKKKTTKTTTTTKKRKVKRKRYTRKRLIKGKLSKRRTKRKVYKWKKLKNSPVPLVTPKARLADALGIRMKKNTFKLDGVSMTKKDKDSNTLSANRFQAGVPSLRLLASNDFEYGVEDNFIEDNISGNTILASRFRNTSYSPQALARRKAAMILSHSDRSRPRVPAVDFNNSSTDLLDSLMEKQSNLHAKSVVIDHDRKIKPIDVKKSQASCKKRGTGYDDSPSSSRSPGNSVSNGNQNLGSSSPPPPGIVFNNGSSSDPNGSQAYSSFLRDYRRSESASPTRCDGSPSNLEKPKKNKKIPKKTDDVDLYSDVEPDEPIDDLDDLDSPEEKSADDEEIEADFDEQDDLSSVGEDLVIDDAPPPKKDSAVSDYYDPTNVVESSEYYDPTKEVESSEYYDPTEELDNNSNESYSNKKSEDKEEIHDVETSDYYDPLKELNKCSSPRLPSLDDIQLPEQPINSSIEPESESSIKEATCSSEQIEQRTTTSLDEIELPKSDPPPYDPLSEIELPKSSPVKNVVDRNYELDPVSDEEGQDLDKSEHEMDRSSISLSSDSLEDITDKMKDSEPAIPLSALEVETISDNEEICFDDENIEEGEILPDNALPSVRPKINIHFNKTNEICISLKEFNEEYEEGEIVDENNVKLDVPKEIDDASKDDKEAENEPKEADKTNETENASVELNNNIDVAETIIENNLVDTEEKNDQSPFQDNSYEDPESKKNDVSFKKISKSSKTRNYRENEKDGVKKKVKEKEKKEKEKVRVYRSRDRDQRTRDINHRDDNRFEREKWNRDDKYRKPDKSTKDRGRFSRDRDNRSSRDRDRNFIKDRSNRNVDYYNRDRQRNRRRSPRGNSADKRERRKELERYNVRQMINKKEEERKKKDEFGRDVSLRSRSRSNSPLKKKRKRKSRSRSPVSRNRKRKRSYSSSSSSSSTSSTSSSSSYSSSSTSTSSSSSRSSSRPPKKKLQKDKTKKKSEKRKEVITLKDSPKKKTVEKIKPKKADANKKDKAKKKKNKDKASTASKEVFQSGGSIMVSVNFSQDKEKNKEKEKKKKDKDTRVDPASKSDNAEYDRWPGSPSEKRTPLQDEPMWSPDNIARARKDDNQYATLDGDEIIMVTPPPQEPILISDSEDEGITRLPPDLGVTHHSPLNNLDSSPVRNHGPKTPPEPEPEVGVKFTLTHKSTLKSITNPLGEDEEEIEKEDDIIPTRGPNTPPGPPPEESDESGEKVKSPGVDPSGVSSPEPDAYDPFDPTKSPSPHSPHVIKEIIIEESPKSIDLRESPPPPLPTSSPQVETKPPEPEKSPEQDSRPIGIVPVSQANLNVPPPTTKTLPPPITKTLPPPIAKTLPTPIKTAPPPIKNVPPPSVNSVQQPSIPGLFTSTPPPQTAPVGIQQIFGALPANVANILYSGALAAAAVGPMIRPAATAQSAPLPDVTKPPPNIRHPPPSQLGKENKQNGQTDIPMVEMDLGSPSSPDSSDISDLFEPPSPRKEKMLFKKTEKYTPRKAQNNLHKHDRFDALFGSEAKQKSQKPRINEKDKLLVAKNDLDEDLPNSAVDLIVKEKLLKKIQRQERVVEEVKLCLKPFYNKKTITKEDYKEIMKKCVAKVCHNRSGEINPNKIRSLVEGYIKKVKYYRKKASGTKGSPGKFKIK